MVDWSKLPEELLGLIAIHLFSVVELLRFRSICKSWRSSAFVPYNNLFPNRPAIRLNPLVTLEPTRDDLERISDLDPEKFLSHASFFRVTLPSSSSCQGWLIKYEVDQNYGTIRLLNPFSRCPLSYQCESIDMLKLTISEIQQAYTITSKEEESFGFKRLVLEGKNRILGVGCDGKIRYWNGEIWTRIKDQVAQFCDIIVHKGLTYALDSKGIIWWISSSLDIFRYGRSLNETMTTHCWKDRCLVECCEELYIVDCLLENNLHKRITFTTNPPYVSVIHDDFGETELKQERGYYPKTIGFKIYKMDEESVKWIEVKSLGDNALMMARDTCFSVLAHAFYGCLENSIYFIEENRYSVDEIKVFNLDDGSITTMSEISQSIFQMFVPRFR